MNRAGLIDFLYQFTLSILLLLVYILFYNFVPKNDDIVTFNCFLDIIL